MGKKKVYELAKELDINSKELISIAKKLGIELKSHLSTLEDNDVEKIKNSANKKENTKPPKREKRILKLLDR